ncbi:MAG TPA: c-type cytochrome [Deltaproteobacteria bacterium]|nr:c-type cytochrome [Deltaproteobacteria bacterium]
MQRPASVLLSVVVLASAGCPQRPFDLDTDEITARYSHKYKEDTCASWLRSQRTGFMYCASPAVMVDIPLYLGPVGMQSGPCDGGSEELGDLMSCGEEVYGRVCAACHQPDGQGKDGMAPPLAGSGEFYGDPQNQADIIVNGLSGPITVQGRLWENLQMPPQGQLSDYEIASTATYVRHSWGNDDGIVLPSDVAAVR